MNQFFADGNCDIKELGMSIYVAEAYKRPSQVLLRLV